MDIVHVVPLLLQRSGKSGKYLIASQKTTSNGFQYRTPVVPDMQHSWFKYMRNTYDTAILCNSYDCEADTSLLHCLVSVTKQDLDLSNDLSNGRHIGQIRPRHIMRGIVANEHKLLSNPWLVKPNIFEDFEADLLVKILGYLKTIRIFKKTYCNHSGCGIALKS